MHNGAPGWNFKSNSCDLYCNRGPNKNNVLNFSSYLGQTSALSPKTDDQPSTVNPRRVFKGR